MITVSICCITYNHAKYIRQCLDGFLNQQCDFEFEVLIHDDASTDGTVEIIREYEVKFPDIIKPIFQEQNQYSLGVRGMNYAYNFPRAKGDYVALCEGDDYWIDPLKLQKQIDFMKSNSDCSLCFTGCEIHKGTGEKKIIKYKLTKLIDVNRYLLNQYFMATASLLLRRDVIKIPNAEWMNSSFAGDFLLRYKALTLGKIGYIDRISVVYNKGTEGSWSNRKLSKDIIEKEYLDNTLGLKFLVEYTSVNNKSISYKQLRLLESRLLKNASMIGGAKGFLLLLKNLRLVGFKSIAFYMKHFLRRKRV